MKILNILKVNVFRLTNPSSNNNFAKYTIPKSHERNSEMRNVDCLQTYHEDSTNYLLSKTKTAKFQISSRHTMM